jgi:hypothetical protein
MPVEGDTGLPGVTVEIMCKRCKGNKEVLVREDITLESLKELLR